eukprot:5154572-Prorocentrum_lima.AAC.1
MPLVQLASTEALTACSTVLPCLEDAAISMSARSSNKSWFKSIPATSHLQSLSQNIDGRLAR